MTRTVILFGICMALLLALMKGVEYMFFIKDMALEVYIGIVGVFFTLLGSWIGWKLTRPKVTAGISAVDAPGQNLTANGLPLPNDYGLSPREHEVLVLIAKGLSYQEIADQLFVSITTVKTHASNIFSKMDVQRRTQAVMLAQKTGLLPPT